ncbi:MAG: 8-amino-7-oxononanoate synthase [bacterium]
MKNINNLKYHYFLSELEKFKKAENYRILSNIQDKNSKFVTFNKTKNLLNLSSNDYLGIATDKILAEEFLSSLINEKIIEKFGLSSSSSRLLTGNYPLYDELENEIINLYGNKEKSCLVFNSGYHANIGVISALFKKGDVIFSDKYNHASIIDGIKLSGADFFRYSHLNYEQLESFLEKNRKKYNKALIISESIFSMDGDKADFQKLVQLKNNYDAVLMVDEAHAIGVFGEKGYGISEQTNLINEIDIIIGTFGKAIASIGAFILVDPILKDYIINKSRSFIFTTALPPVNIFWTLKVIKLLPKLQKQREHLAKISELLRSSLRNFGLDTLGESQIVPVIIGNNNDTIKIAKKLQNKGYLMLPVRPPTVPEGTSRIRISLTALLQWDDIKNIPEIIADNKLIN